MKLSLIAKKRKKDEDTESKKTICPIDFHKTIKSTTE